MKTVVQVPGGGRYRVTGRVWTGPEPEMVRLLTAVSGIPRPGYEPDLDRADAEAAVARLPGVKILTDQRPRSEKTVEGAVF